MNSIMDLNKTINKLLQKIETFKSDPTLESIQRFLQRFRDELSKPEVSPKYLGRTAGALSRIIHESIWADTPFGDEILFFLAELRKYRKSLEENNK